MGRTLQRYFEGLWLLLLATGFGTLAVTGRLPWAVTAPAGAAFLARGFCFWRHIEARLPARTLGWALLAYSPIYVLDGLYFSPGFVAATLHLVVLTGAAQLFGARSGRDHLTLGLLAMLEVLAAALLTVSGLFFLLFLVFLVLLIAALVAYEMLRAQAESTAAPLPRRPLLRPLLRFSLGLSGAVAGVSLLIFFLLPRLTPAAWAARPPTALSGFSDEVSLGAIADLQRNDVTVMHVKIAAAADPSQFLYMAWRGRGLTRFDGRRWYSPSTPALVPTAAGRLDFAPPAAANAGLIHYQVTLEPIASSVLFFPPRLLQADTPFPVLAWDRTTDTLSRPGAGGTGVTYSGVSALESPNAAALRALPNLNGSGRNPYLQLPDDLDPRVAPLARTITASSAADNWDRMQALTAYLQTHYRYSLEDLPQGPHPLARFLFDQPSGDCEYFASALAVMARTLGIPTRVVNGFVLGSYNRLSGQYLVRGSDAHSWVEAWFPAPPAGGRMPRGYSRGQWITFDATPASQTVTVSAFPVAGMLLDALSSAWQEWIVNFDWLRQIQLARQLKLGATAAQGQAAALAAAAGRWLATRLNGHGGWWAVALLMAGLGVGWRRGWWRPLGHRPPLAEQTEQMRLAQAAYRRFQRYLRRAGFPRPPAETAPELAARVEAARPGSPLAASAAAFAAVYTALRFGPDTADWRLRLQGELRKVKHAAGWRRRRSNS